MFTNKFTDFVKDNTAKIWVFVGAYGSGKSEVAVNFGKQLRTARPEQQLVLVDIDIVNPFYRSADAGSFLTKQRIRLIKPPFANTNSDVPALSPEVYTVFDDPDNLSIMDVGGDDLGAKVLGSMAKRFLEIEYQLIMVVNTCRPFTQTPEAIMAMARQIETASKMSITGLLNNTNILEATSFDLVIDSIPTVQAAAQQLGVPLCFTAVMESLIPDNWLTAESGQRVLLPMERWICY